MDGILSFAIILQTSWTSTIPNTNVINRTDTIRKSKCFIIAGDKENSVFICKHWNPMVLLLVRSSTYFKKKCRWILQLSPVICQIISKTNSNSHKNELHADFLVNNHIIFKWNKMNHNEHNQTAHYIIVPTSPISNGFHIIEIFSSIIISTKKCIIQFSPQLPIIWMT